MASLEEASHCPKCSEAGALERTTPTHGGKKVLTYVCRNERCVWNGTAWVVQVNADGSIPERKPGTKEFPALIGFGEASARRQLEEIARVDPSIARAIEERKEAGEW